MTQAKTRSDAQSSGPPRAASQTRHPNGQRPKQTRKYQRLPAQPNSSNGHKGLSKEETKLAEFLNTQAMDAERLNHYAMDILTRILINNLIVRKKLPQFYFHEEARRAGINPANSRSWRIKEWATTNMRNRDKFKGITEVLLRVQIRLWNYPHQETYWQANSRLKRRLRELMRSGYTHNRIAQHLNMSFKSLKEILAKEERVRCRPKHCPWELLENLKKADKAIDRRATMSPTPAEQKRAQERRQAEAQYQEALKRARDNMEDHIIPTGGGCWNCNAPWSSLRYECDTDDYPKYRWFKCYQCERDNFTEAPRIVPYSGCGTCHRPWPNLRKVDIDPDGNVVRLCMNCLSHNIIVKKKIQPEPFSKPIMEVTRELEILEQNEKPGQLARTA